MQFIRESQCGKVDTNYGKVCLCICACVREQNGSRTTFLRGRRKLSGRVKQTE